MPSLFNKTDNEAVIARIENLTSDSIPIWGKLNVAQMLKHTEIGIKIAFGEVKLKRNLLGILFGKMAKKKLMAEEPFGKNLPTDKTFMKFDDPQFEEAKSSLINSIRQFADKGETVITKETHPFFGELTTAEWDKLNWKHLDHHLRQFGV